MSKLEKIIEYQFSDKALLVRALTHSSHSTNYFENYERLEFLGDRVLGLCIASMMYDIFPSEHEGGLSQRYVGLVNKDAVAKVALNIGLEKHIIANGIDVQHNENILCDIAEALIGAIFIDGGYAEAFKFVNKHWLELVHKNTSPPKDAKTTLQEIAHAKALGVPTYSLIKREGSEHEPIFHMSVSFPKVEAQIGVGKNKKNAEQEAAVKMLEFIGYEYA